MDLLLVWRNWYPERGLAFDDAGDPYIAAFHRKASTTLDFLDRLAPDLAGPPSIGHVSIGCALGLLDFRWSELRLAHWPARHRRVVRGVLRPSVHGGHHADHRRADRRRGARFR